MARTNAVADARALPPGGEESGADSENGPPAAKNLLERLRRLSRKQLILFAAPLVLVLGLGVALGIGALDPLLIRFGIMDSKADGPYSGPPVYFDLPDMVINLDMPNGQIRLLRASISLELSAPADKEIVKALMPRIQDAIQTLLRSLGPADLQGSAQTYRLRDELLQRVGVAIGAEHVRRVWFRELLVR